jgi:hypothetical protein
MKFNTLTSTTKQHYSGKKMAYGKKKIKPKKK